jgi:predicted metalloendopeptidase
VVNAFYEQSINSIGKKKHARRSTASEQTECVFCVSVIPLAVLTEPYFQQDMPRYIPYGTMGLIFTHEILHAFDMLGTRFIF